jgi:hypothetical protein
LFRLAPGAICFSAGDWTRLTRQVDEMDGTKIGRLAIASGKYLIGECEMNYADFRMAKAIMNMRLEEMRRLTEFRDLLRRAGAKRRNGYPPLETR